MLPIIQLSDEKETKDSSIKVYIRVRPLVKQELANAQILSVDQDGKTVYLDNSCSQVFKQTFDKAFGVESQQHEIFDEFQQQQKLVLQGYNFSVLAYGQTGSGKTYTMFGNDWENMTHNKKEVLTKLQHQSTFLEEIATDKNNAGMIPRSIYQLFNIVDQANLTDGLQYHVYCSFSQIYNEKVYDLLVDCDQPVALPIRESKLDGVFIEGLSEYAVNHYYDCLILMKRGEKNRFIRQTSMNAKSSRSHTIFQLLIESSKVDSAGHLKKSKINLCDLAGSEKVRTEEVFNKAHFSELVSINLSLTILGKVIQNLSQNSQSKKALPIPYRESKLTRLLQDSLGGNTQTYFIANVSSSLYHLDETHSTLKFAERAKNIQLKIVPNKINAINSDLVKKLTTEINYLKSLLNMKRSGININDVHFNMMKLQAENNRLRTTNVTVNEVEKLISDNRNMKMEIQILHQSATLNQIDLDQKQTDKSEFFQIQETDQISHYTADKFSFPITHSVQYPQKYGDKTYSQTNLQSNNHFMRNKRNGETSTFRINDASTFRNGGMMVIENYDTIPKTEVAVRIKGRNNQYSSKRGFVEQSDRQYTQELRIKSEKNRVMERLNHLDTMKRENQNRMQQDISQIESRTKSHNNSERYDRYELKEKGRINLYNKQLRNIGSNLILTQLK